MELSFIEEEVPKITRVGGAGREAEPWELHIAPLKDAERAGKSFRVWTYEKRTSAVSRMSSVRDRLTKAVPEENWTLAVRPIPNTQVTNEDGTVTPQQGVYVQYNGTFTDAEIAENAQRHQERSQRVKAARAATQAKVSAEDATSTEAEPTEVTDQPTAKERVAAAKAKAGATA